MGGNGGGPVSESAVRTVGVLVRSDLGQAGDTLRELVAWLRRRDLVPLVDEGTAALVPEMEKTATVVNRLDLGARADAVVVLGGDGTLLAASHVIARPVPILGVNFGSLGFLTEIALAELYTTLESVLAGTYRYEERRMLHAVVAREGRPEKSGDVLNDVVITKAALSRIIAMDVSIDGVFVSAFHADGLIVSSPTGSTAYNLAAGGPILYPTLRAVVLTPICPHMLTNRPLVVSDEASIEIRLASVRDEVHITFDGQHGFPLTTEDVVTVTRSERALRLVRPARRNYYSVLRSKLKWGESSVRRS